MIEPTDRVVSDVLLAVKRQFGDESGTQVTDQDIYRWIDEAQNAVVSNNPEVNQVLATIDVQKGVTQYPLLDALPNIHKIHSIMYDGDYLSNISFAEAQERIIRKEDDPSMSPSFWYEYAGVLHLWPIPQKEILSGLSIFFSKSPIRVTSDGQLLSVPNRYFKSVVDYCLQQAHEMDENPEMSQLKGQQFQTFMTTVANETTAQQRSYPTIRYTDED